MWKWCPAGALKPGDELVVHDQREAPEWGDAQRAALDKTEGYLLGLLVGDGTIKSDKAVLSAWPGRAVVNGGEEHEGVRAVMANALEAACQLRHRADFVGWMDVPGRGEYRLSLASLKRLAADYGLKPRGKTVTPGIERSPRAFHQGFLRAFRRRRQRPGSSRQGCQRSPCAEQLVRARFHCGAAKSLLRLGIASTIYTERRPAGATRLPDGRGGTRLYTTRAQHELVIAGDNLPIFAERVGFADTDKAGRLAMLLANYRRRLNREPFVATVASVEPAGEAEVFDAAIPEAQRVRRERVVGPQLRRTAAAAVWRVPAGVGQSGAVCRAPVYGGGAARYRGAGRVGAGCRNGCSTISSTFPAFRSTSEGRGAAEAADRAWDYRAGRCADSMRAALRIAASGGGDRGLASARSGNALRLSGIDSRNRRRERRFPGYSTRKNTWPARRSRHCRRTSARRLPATASATRC